MVDIKEKTVLNGIGLMILATVLFSIMHASIKFMSTSMHPFVIAFFRNLFGLLVIAPWFIKYGLKPLKTNRIKLHMARSFFNVIAMLSFFYSLSIAPLADVASLAFTAPLFASILAVIFLKEIVGIKRGIAIIFGFIGALIVIDPVYSSINNGHILVLLSASVWSVSLIIIKILGRTESSVTITSYMVIIMIPLSAVAAYFYWELPTIKDLFYLMIIGVCGTGAQMLLAQALRQGDTSIIMPFDFLKLIWAVGIGYLFFFEVPSLNTWIGGFVIFLSTLYIAYREKVLSKKRIVKNITQPVDQ
jgi:drug/metabolite transporter (DMT)-like permease